MIITPSSTPKQKNIQTPPHDSIPTKKNIQTQVGRPTIKEKKEHDFISLHFPWLAPSISASTISIC